MKHWYWGLCLFFGSCCGSPAYAESPYLPGDITAGLITGYSAAVIGDDGGCYGAKLAYALDADLSLQATYAHQEAEQSHLTALAVQHGWESKSGNVLSYLLAGAAYLAKDGTGQDGWRIVGGSGIEYWGLEGRFVPFTEVYVLGDQLAPSYGKGEPNAYILGIVGVKLLF